MIQYFNFKSLKETPRQLVLTYDVSKHVPNYQRDLIKAIAVLTGGYNVYGRNIKIENFNLLSERFDEIVQEISLQVE